MRLKQLPGLLSDLRFLGWIAIGAAGFKALLMEFEVWPASFPIAKSTLGLLLLGLVLLMASRPIHSSGALGRRLGEIVASTSCLLILLSLL